MQVSKNIIRSLFDILKGFFGIPKSSSGIPGGLFGIPKSSSGTPKSLFGIPGGSFGIPKSSSGTPKSSFGIPGGLFGIPKRLFCFPQGLRGMWRNLRGGSGDVLPIVSMFCAMRLCASLLRVFSLRRFFLSLRGAERLPVYAGSASRRLLRREDGRWRWTGGYGCTKRRRVMLCYIYCKERSLLCQMLISSPVRRRNFMRG
jgi:hypothetical protein